MWNSIAHKLTGSLLRAIAHGVRGIVLNNHVQTAVQIRAQVEALSPFFDFIGYDELQPRLNISCRGRPFCLLTFDDGKAVNAEETAPELLRLGVPGVFFLTTGFVGRDEPLWFDRFATLRRAGVPSLADLVFWKSMAWQERDRAMERLCKESGMEADLTDSTVRMMSWGDAVRLQGQGFEIGSHTERHAVLTMETMDEACRQLTSSLQALADHGLRTRTFAFPNGNCNRELVQSALQSGFESTFSTAPVWLGRSEEMSCLPRLFLKETADAFYIHKKLLAARPGFVLHNSNGARRRYRHNRVHCRISSTDSREK